MSRKATEADKARMAARSAYIKAIRDQTVCQTCGGQPIEWHHPDHPTQPHRRVAYGSVWSIEHIDAEIAACTALCRCCHMAEDGRLDALRIAGRREPGPPRACENCARLYKPLRNGRCWPCYSYIRRTGYERSPRLYERGTTRVRRG